MSHSPSPCDAENLIDARVAGLIRCKSHQILRQTRLPRSDVEDIEQALTLLLLQRLPQFDATQGQWEAFVRMVLRQATINVLRYYRAAKRGCRNAVSLDAFLRTEGDEPLYPVDRSTEPTAEQQVDLAHDIAAALKTLPVELQVIAEELRTHSLTEVARKRGMPRSTLRERAQEIRAAFESRALSDYL